MGGSSSETSAIRPVQMGRYTLFKKLAVGGMAEIWLARQRGVADFNRLVVIKKILNHLTDEEEFRDMFADEARICSALVHPNIAQVYDLGEHDGAYFLSMELVLGETVGALSWRAVKRGGPVPATVAARLIADACKALDHAHNARAVSGSPLGIVHRDVSPQNILVTYEGDVKVIDFGIAKAESRAQRSPLGEVKGKLSYMSPEQVMGLGVDARTDVFALGIVLYELCSGRRLFKDESEYAVVDMITRRPVPPPSQYAPDVPPALDAIVARALAKDRNDRTASARVLHAELEAFIHASSEAASTSDVGRYVRGLFEREASDKRRLCEAATRWEDETPELTPTVRRRAVPPLVSTPPRAGPRSTPPRSLPPPSTPPPMVTRPQHSQVHINGRPLVPPQPRPVAYTPVMAPFTAHDQLHAPADVTWLPRLIMALSAVVMVLVGVYLALELRAPPKLLPVAPPPVPSVGAVKMGRISLESEPAGAAISVNGVMLKWQGQPVRTPIAAIENLQYGATYTIELLKDGYPLATRTVVMGTATDGQVLRVALTRPR